MTNLARSPRMAGDAIKTARLNRNWTQSELASRMGVRQATVSKLESGEPATRLEVLFDALAALDLELKIGKRGDDVDFGDLF